MRFNHFNPTALRLMRVMSGSRLYNSITQLTYTRSEHAKSAPEFCA